MHCPRQPRGLSLFRRNGAFTRNESGHRDLGISMALTGESVAHGRLRRARSDGSSSVAAEDHQQWEDYTCATEWEDLIRCLEDVLRDWACTYDGDCVSTGTSLQNDGGSSASAPRTSYSRCLEHEGQLFSIKLVPPFDCPRDAGTTTSGAASAACDLDNPSLDFAMEDGITPPQRWFGLKQYVLLRALGQSGSKAISVDQLLWAAGIASANCQSPIPVLVSCDWDGLESEEEQGSGEGDEGDAATCRGYSAPGSKGVACSVRFQTATVQEPPAECLYLDGLTKLFLSKIMDSHSLPGRAFAPKVSTTVQQSWLWKKPDTDSPIPAPGLLPERTRALRGRPDSVARPNDATGVTSVPSVAKPGTCTTGVSRRTTGVAGSVSGTKQEAVDRLLRAIGEGAEGLPLWGPREDPLRSVCVRVRWTDLREGLVEESEHFSTLEALPQASEPTFGDESSGPETSAGCWYIAARWKKAATQAVVDPHCWPPSVPLGDACFRLLAALVLATAMHPGTLMADLGAAADFDGPMATAEDYGRAAAAMLSGDARAAVESLCGRTRSPPIEHDQIDLLLRRLLHPRVPAGEDSPDVSDAASTGAGQRKTLDVAETNGRPVPEGGAAVDRSLGRPLEGPLSGSHPGQASEWRQVYPKPPEQGESLPRASEMLDPGTKADGGAGTEWPGGGLWASSARGGAPVGRLLSLMSRRLADCDDVRSMALLWMSFVRDVRHLWEEGAAIPRLEAIPEVDGTGMFDGTVTGQSRAVAAQLRGSRRDCCTVGRNVSLRSKSEPYPDTRMCLIWQKLQMLNCCRQTADEAATASFVGDRGGPPSNLGAGHTDAPGEETDDDTTMFFDTREFDQSCEEGDDEIKGEIHDDSGVPSAGEDRLQGDHQVDVENPSASVASPRRAEAGGTSGSDRDADPAGPAIPPLDTGGRSSLARTAVNAENSGGGAGGETEQGATRGDGAKAPTANACDRKVLASRLLKPLQDRAQPISEGTTEEQSTSAVEDDRSCRSGPDESGSGVVSDGQERCTVDVTLHGGEEGEGELDGSGARLAANPAANFQPTVASCTREGSSADDHAGSEPSEGQACKQELEYAGEIEGKQSDVPAGAAIASSERLPELKHAMARTQAPSSTSKGALRLLRTKSLMRGPTLQASGPVTSDMLDHQRLRQTAGHREREVLVSDMHSFRLDNDGAVFADFVRWYRPDCWQDAPGSAAGAQEGDERATGSAEDDRRLAWPGHGQVLWKVPNYYRDSNGGRASTSETAPAASPLTLGAWLSCWEKAGDLKDGRRAPPTLFNAVKEGEKALHYLETISPGPLLMQLLSAVLSLSAFVVEEAASSHEELPAAQIAAAEAKHKVAEAVQLLADTRTDEGDTDAHAGDALTAKKESSNRSRRALLAADAACLAVRKAEDALAKAVSIHSSFPGQRELANAIIDAEVSDGGFSEAAVESRAQKEFLRDLLVAQGLEVDKTTADLDQLLARLDEDAKQADAVKDGSKAGEGVDQTEGPGGAMPPPHSKEYVLRCRTPAPFYGRNKGRGQIAAYPTPSSRMYAKTDGRTLRVALSLCESEI